MTNPTQSLIQYFLLNHIPFKECPEELQKNDLFIFHYFSKNVSNHKEYIYIPSHVLNNPIFLFQSISMNPDIYLLCDIKQQTEELYALLYSKHPKKILQYASKEQLNDIEFCSNIINKYISNYQYANEEVRKSSNIVYSVFCNPGHLNTILDNNLIKYIPLETLNNFPLMQNIVHKNPKIFSKLPKSLRKNKEFCSLVMKDNPSLYSFIDSSLKEDRTFISPFLEGNINKELFLSLPISYFTKDFCKKFEGYIYDNFCDLPLTHRHLKPVLDIGFSFFENYDKYHRRIAFMHNNYIKEKARNFLKQYQHASKTQYPEIIQGMMNIIEDAFLHEKLDETMPINSEISKPKL